MIVRKYGYKAIFGNTFFLIWMSIFLSFLSGHIISGGVIYIYNPEILPGLLFDPIISLLLSSLFSVLIIKYKFEQSRNVWVRLLLSIVIPLGIGFLNVFIFGNSVVDSLIINLNLAYLEVFFGSIMLVITIISGLVFIKPWKSLINFTVGSLYVAVLSIVLLFYVLILSGLLHDNWL